ncbi:peroxisomal membrane protein, partial [Reticulomyxa filosa]
RLTWDTVSNWLDELSGGQKQRVAMARVFYHRPKFAILDECTSGVDPLGEQTLYTLCKQKYKITLLTISHRISVWDYHDYMLDLDPADSKDYEDANDESNHVSNKVEYRFERMADYKRIKASQLHKRFFSSKHFFFLKKPFLACYLILKFFLSHVLNCLSPNHFSTNVKRIFYSKKKCLDDICSWANFTLILKHFFDPFEISLLINVEVDVFYVSPFL